RARGVEGLGVRSRFHRNVQAPVTVARATVTSARASSIPPACRRRELTLQDIRVGTRRSAPRRAIGHCPAGRLSSARGGPRLEAGDPSNLLSCAAVPASSEVGMHSPDSIPPVTSQSTPLGAAMAVLLEMEDVIDEIPYV